MLASYKVIFFSCITLECIFQEGAAAQKAGDDQSPLGQAYLKYLDALSLDETRAVYHFHVGRLLVIQGDYDEAIKRLEATLGWNAKHHMAKSVHVPHAVYRS